MTAVISLEGIVTFSVNTAEVDRHVSRRHF